MKMRFLLGLVVFLGIGVRCIFADYTIGPGDTIEINIITAPEFSRTVIVRPDGKVNLPFLDTINVRGMTVEDFSKFLSKKYSHYLKDPVIDVSIKRYESQKISILGQVFRPGIYPLRGPSTLIEALTMAGGYKYGAALRHVIIVRKGLWAQNPEIVTVNLYRILKKKKFYQDPILKPGDVVYVPDSFLAKLDRFTDFFFSKIRPSLQLSLETYDVQHPSERYQ
jgi:polysaccharide export outer membrane protein